MKGERGHRPRTTWLVEWWWKERGRWQTWRDIDTADEARRECADLQRTFSRDRFRVVRATVAYSADLTPELKFDDWRILTDDGRHITVDEWAKENPVDEKDYGND